MITALVGGQYGSEGKGLIVGHIAGSYRTHIRVGAANAGHTVYVDGEKHVLQQLPCAAYANPYANLVLGPGAMISPDILREEVEVNRSYRLRRGLPPMRLFIDYRAHVVLPEHIDIEQRSNLAERIGSTSTLAKEGIGAAQAARVMREGYGCIKLDAPWLYEYANIGDIPAMLMDAQIFDESVLLEGTQGTGLSNTTGQYPYVTSRNTTAAGLAADCGIGPRDIDHVIMVCRTFPIRVAGPSGPFWSDSKEIAWHDVGIDPERERTTVTKKVRRVATFSYDQIRYAARLNSATEIALTFADYLTPHIAGHAGYMSADEFHLYDHAAAMVAEIERRTYTPVTMIGTGPQTVIEREPKRIESLADAT